MSLSTLKLTQKVFCFDVFRMPKISTNVLLADVCRPLSCFLDGVAASLQCLCYLFSSHSICFFFTKKKGKDLMDAGHAHNVYEVQEASSISAERVLDTNIRNMPYEVCVTFSSLRQVSDAKCGCMAGISGTRKHTAAVLGRNYTYGLAWPAGYFFSLPGQIEDRPKNDEHIHRQAQFKAAGL